MRWTSIPLVAVLSLSGGCAATTTETWTGAPHDSTSAVASATTTPPTAAPMSTTTSTTTVTSGTTLPTTTTSQAPPPTTAPAPPPLAVGSHGPEVATLQQQLVGLGYWTGETDGVFGTGTRHAVVAFQKVHGLARDGAVGPLTAAALATAGRAPAASRVGHVTEVDIAHQVVIIADDGWTTWVFDASTGSVPGSTPAGRWQVFIQIDGYEHGNLGVLYRPRYFAPRIAVHGYPDVPTWPASHGCVRVANATMDFIWATDLMPMGSAVWVY